VRMVHHKTLPDGRVSERRTRRRTWGGSSVEYLLVIMVAVIPIALCTPMLTKVVQKYTNRVMVVIRSPLG
jgi:hypothetical protein